MAASSPRQPLLLQAGSSEELVEQLRELTQLPESVSLAEFMDRFAHRLEQISPGRRLRTDSSDHFIADLMEYGWIKLSSSS